VRSRRGEFSSKGGKNLAKGKKTLQRPKTKKGADMKQRKGPFNKKEGLPLLGKGKEKRKTFSSRGKKAPHRQKRNHKGLGENANDSRKWKEGRGHYLLFQRGETGKKKAPKTPAKKKKGGKYLIGLRKGAEGKMGVSLIPEVGRGLSRKAMESRRRAPPSLAIVGNWRRKKLVPE